MAVKTAAEKRNKKYTFIHHDKHDNNCLLARMMGLSFGEIPLAEATHHERTHTHTYKHAHTFHNMPMAMIRVRKYTLKKRSSFSSGKLNRASERAQARK